MGSCGKEHKSHSLVYLYNLSKHLCYSFGIISKEKKNQNKHNHEDLGYKAGKHQCLSVFLTALCTLTRKT